MANLAASGQPIIYMTRNPPEPGCSNTLNPQASQFKFYENSYAAGTTQESIYLPDFEGGSVTLSFPVAGTASVEVSDSPPDVIDAGNGIWIASASFSSISATVTSFIKGATALRVNRASGTIKISVRV
jgi:hypothetical protein